MFCPNCGSSVPSGSSFCPNCGSPLTGGSGGAGGGSTLKGGAGTLLYTARRSAWYYAKQLFFSVLAIVLGLFLSIVFFLTEDAKAVGFVFLIVVVVAAFVLFFTILAAKKFRLDIYDNRIVVREGIFSTKERQSIMTPIIGVSVNQSFWGKICGYGNIVIDKVGKGWDVKTTCIKDPYKLRTFLESLIDTTDYSRVGTFIAD